MSVLEALSAGTPGIVPNHGAFAAVVSEGVEGLMFSACDSGSLSTVLQTALEASEGAGTQLSANARILVTGPGGFIGHHLVKRLRTEGNWLRGVDLKAPEYEATDANEFEILDLRHFDHALLAGRGGIDQVYNLAADLGGIGFI